MEPHSRGNGTLGTLLAPGRHAMATKNVRFSGAPRSGRWTQPPSTQKRGRRGLLFLFALGAALLGGVSGFAWEMDRQVLGGILRQRQEAARRPDWTPIRRLPAYVPQAFATVVDPTFEDRRPLDEGVEGTTLSRELVRQIHLLRRNLAGEAREIIMGPLLERRLSKSEVLELYLNRVYMGRLDGFPVYGIHHAAREFFGKRPEELTLSQTATLAGLLLPPRITRPERQLGAVGARRNEVLRQMRVAGEITPAALEAAIREPLGFVATAEYTPMTRPVGWDAPQEPLRLPPSQAAAGDTAVNN
ncbi:hypothetical protein BH20GEM3_BH20GEM3_10530 [soil metagenome]